MTAVCLSLALVATFVAASPSTVLGAVACGSGPTFVFDGTEPPGNHNYGVRADLEKRVPALCGANWSDSSLWVMTTGGCSEEYMQSGYGRHQGEGTVYPFAQYDLGIGSSFVHKQLGDPPPAGSSTYYTKYNFSTGKISGVYDNQTLLSVNVDIAWCTGRGSLFDAETHDEGDDVPGTAANKASVSSMVKIASRGGGWVNLTNQKISSESDRYDVDWSVNQQHMRVWTK
jgi:hypothetical protein